MLLLNLAPASILAAAALEEGLDAGDGGLDGRDRAGRQARAIWHRDNVKHRSFVVSTPEPLAADRRYRKTEAATRGPLLTQLV